MIVFSLQKNKLWNGSGFIVKPGLLELSSLCFAEQLLNIGSGKYKVKVVGSSISGNGIFSIQVQLGEREIFSKMIALNGKSNTEASFDLELVQPGPYKIKIFRGKESIGRISISLINFFKIIEKKEEIILNGDLNNKLDTEKTFVVIDYDELKSASEISSLFLKLKDFKNCFFLVKTSQSFVEKTKELNFRLFFEWDDLFDYLSISNPKKVTYFESNLNNTIFYKYNVSAGILIPIKSENKGFSRISGIIF